MKVLLVEDDPMVTKVTCVFFKINHPDATVTVAADGQSAIQQALENDFEVILMDYGLPDMSGIEVTKKLRSEGVTTPIVGLSGNLGSVSDADMEAAGLNGAFEKPLTPEKWQQIVAICLQG